MIPKTLAIASLIAATHLPFAAAQTAPPAAPATAPASPTSIERIAPENAILIVGTHNCQNLMERFQHTPLWSLWQTDQMKKMREEAVKEMGEQFDKMIEELGVEKESVIPPTGAAGFALFMVRDAELDTPKPAFIALADYGDAANAEKMDGVVQAALTRGEKDGDIEFEQKDVNGRSVFVIDMSKMEKKAEDAKGDHDDDMDMDMDGGMMPVPKPKDLAKDFRKIHYVRDGSVLMLGSDFNALSEAIEASDGKAAHGAGRLTDRADYQGVMSKIGESDLYAVVLTRDIMELLSANDPMGMMQMMRPVLRSLVGEVQGYGAGVRLDGSTAMVEQTVTAYMPKGKQGLTSLIDTPLAAGALPAFVGSDAVSYSAMSFRFSGLMDTIRKVVSSNPMLAAQAGPQVDAAAPMINQITANLGNRVHWATSVTKPFNAQSRQTLVGIECTNAQEFENVFGPLAAQAGIEGRDFLGQRIYTLDPDMMAMMMPMGGESGPMSLGIGGGFIMLGATPAVEQGLRATSQPGGASLASSADFQRAMGVLSREGAVAWGFTDTIDSMESSIAAQKDRMEQMIKEMREGGEDMAEEDAKEMKEIQDRIEANMRDQMKIWDQFDFNLLRQHIGPSAWQVQSTDDGFVLKAFVLGAGKPQ